MLLMLCGRNHHHPLSNSSRFTIQEPVKNLSKNSYCLSQAKNNKKKMKMKTSRARGRRERATAGRGAQQTQDYPYTPPLRASPPLRTRYATRSSTAVAPQLLPLSPKAIAVHNPTLRTPIRFLNEDRVTATAKPDSPGCSSLLNGADPAHESSEVDVKPSTPAESFIGPFSEYEAALNDSQPPEEKNLEVQCHDHTQEKNKTVDDPRSSQCPSQTRSLNLTEYARGLHENSDEDMEEVDSHPNHEYVQGHIVKKEIADFVRAIFNKYGDLTKESDVKSPKIISFFFERLHDVYKMLEQKNLLNFTSGEIGGMIDDLQFFQQNKLEVRWLMEKLAHISEIKSSILKYLEIKGEAGKCIELNKRIDKEVEQSQMHITLIQKKIAAAEEEKVANEAKANEYLKMVLSIKAKVRGLANQSLVHGLL